MIDQTAISLYDIATLENMIPKVFNKDYSIKIAIQSSGLLFTVQTEGVFNPTDLNVNLTDIALTLHSPAGELVGHGLTIWSSWNDILRQIQAK